MNRINPDWNQARALYDKHLGDAKSAGWDGQRYADKFQACPIPFGPKGAIDAKLDIIRQWTSPGLWVQTWMMTRSNSRSTPTEICHHMSSITAAADVYWVGEDMCALLETAAPGVPADTSLQPELLSTKHGLVFFASTICGTDTEVGGTVPVDAVHWCPGIRYEADGTPHHELVINCYSYGRVLGWSWMGGSNWPLGERLDDHPAHEVGDVVVSSEEDRRLVLAFLALIASPGVATVSRLEPDRAVLRRAKRRNVALDSVRVVYLRRLPHDNDGQSDGTSRYYHRWIVSGHWRSQPYGTDRSKRKPVWIAPHVKGPEGAPLLHGEKVRAVVR